MVHLLHDVQYVQFCGQISLKNVEKISNFKKAATVQTTLISLQDRIHGTLYLPITLQILLSMANPCFAYLY